MSTLRKGILRLQVILCIIFVILSGCGKREIRIGAVLPLSGIRKNFGEVMKNGMDLAIDDVNQQGLFNGKLVCYYEDDESDEVKAKEAALRLVKKKGVIALVGSYSNLNTLAVANVAEETHTPMISPTSAAEEVSTGGFEWVFRLNSPSSQYALTMLDFMDNTLHVRRIAVLHENDDFGKRTAKMIEKYARELKGHVIFSEGYDTKTSDFTGLLLEAKSGKPDALMMISHLDDGVAIMKAVKKIDLNVKAYAGCGAGYSHVDLIKNGRKDVEFLFTVTQWSDQADWTGAKLFAEHYAERFGEPPGYHSAETYSTVQVLAGCFQKKGSGSRNGLRKALLAADIDTVFGKIRFENYGDYSNQNTHTMLIQQIQDGRFILVWPKQYQKGAIRFPTPSWNKRPN